MKKILFDLDNTIIEFLDEYDLCIDKAFNYFNMACDDNLRKKIVDAFHEYEKDADIIDKKEMNTYISNKINVNLPDDFTCIWQENISSCAPVNDLEMIDLFKYLASKYEIYVTTNWFTDTQVKRLEKLGILPYIKEVIGCDKIKKKPNLEMYKYFLNDCSNKDVIVVGDNFEVDIVPAIELGIYAYHITDEIKKTKDNIYGVIKNIKELKDLL